MSLRESRREAIDAGCSPPHAETPASSRAEASSSHTKRSDVLRHVFPRSHLARNSFATSGIASRVVKLSHKNGPPLSPARRSKPRVAFHRALTSFFNTGHTAITVPIPHDPNNSASSSIRSRTNSNSLHGSMPSLEFVSSGAFIFSGPSLRSRSGSFNNSTPRLPSLREDSEDFNMLHRVHFDTFSFDDIAVVHSLSDESSAAPSANRSLLSSALAAVFITYLDGASLEALRSTCKEWRAAIDRNTPSRQTASHCLPTEILHNVFRYLGPRSFNAARHTCRHWMRASLDRKLLRTMLERGGWLSYVENLHTANLADHQPTPSNASNLWSLSRMLSRECSLSFEWTGSGVPAKNRQDSGVFAEVSHTDFTDLAGGHSGSEARGSAGLVFTTSRCGLYVLVGRETIMYVYHVQGSSLEPVTSIVCPRRVLAMSMDISYGRNAVAALLEGRMGMVCELHLGWDLSNDPPGEILVRGNNSLYETTARGASIHSSQTKNFETGINTADRCSRFAARPDSQIPYIESVDVKSNHQATSLHAMHDQRMHAQNYINHTTNLNLQGPRHNASFTSISDYDQGSCTLPVEDGTSTFYRHLCSEDDPPRSVSICPQHHCVAFGCAAGIELHWIDALTGQSLSRWFPLTAPSDYLHFLAPRPGFDSAKKLRLISSAARPNDKPGIRRKFFFEHPNVSSFWGSFGFQNHPRRLGSPHIDHYHAVPLSDGHHILFIDPKTEKLFLGCDAPLGGPMKLLRKVMFLPPCVGSQAPRLYTAAFDMSLGARVVVVFDDTLVLYSIPPDVYHWLNWWDEPSPSERAGNSTIWPVAIRGQEIGKLQGVSELAIHTEPDITIWGFTLDAQCKTWQMRNHADPIIHCRYYICRGGAVHEVYLTGKPGRAVATHASSASFGSRSPVTSRIASPDFIAYGPERPVGFDGHCSQTLHAPNHGSSTYSEPRPVKRLPGAMNVKNDEWVDFLDVRGGDAWFEENGDVMMVRSCHPDDYIEMGGLLTSCIAAVGCARWRYGAGRGD
ncbi:uncharacterized protein CC84DRAFT_1155234 [Paraphaeosphaeria sporulosa]|uniref:F-box domain-containing protein n=1 Tax=Paraphaeosphaeria sporulosa TaxID=1460663 RepID=A0A177BZM2_9PLEO|nr:uncharacterized protein CC84DRAFT_1155234 [Paraphaeosphaeria sporulosa]OAG00431.1 hypothetical protein CC84DRAFT_1155234 [Paraphaeosphaeria sporulosa]